VRFAAAAAAAAVAAAADVAVATGGVGLEKADHCTPQEKTDAK